ncbi:MAG: VanZ family protein [Deltaproteobacteria bacterium]|nr:VanZ family protein [Deltaproteobacteria bacterium]
MSARQAPARVYALAAALGWWGIILALIPYARDVIDLLRARSLLMLAVTAAFAVLFLGLIGLAAWLRRAGALSGRQVLVGTALLALGVAAAQLFERPEDRWHAIEYGVLGVLFWAATTTRGLPRVLFAAVATGGCGWLDEAVQFLVPSRVYDPWDVGLNAGAGLASVGIAEIVARCGDEGDR